MTFFKLTHIWDNTVKTYLKKNFIREGGSSFCIILVTRLLMVSCGIIFLSLSAKASSVYSTEQKKLVTATQAHVGLDKDGIDNIDIVHSHNLEPLPVTLTYLAVSQDIYDGMDANHIEWTMSSEIGTRGFYILRSTTNSYTDAVMISGFIPCLGGVHSENMSQYEYWDTHIISTRVSYVYWLEEEKDVGRTIYGPLYISGSNRTVEDDIPAGASQSDINIYLPIIAEW